MIRSVRWKGAAFTSPFLIGFVFVFLIPIGYAIYQSLFLEQQSGLGLGGTTNEFVGLRNYGNGFTDGTFLASVWRVVSDRGLRSSLVAAGRRRLGDFELAKTRATFTHAIEQLLSEEAA